MHTPQAQWSGSRGYKATRLYNQVVFLTLVRKSNAGLGRNEAVNFINKLAQVNGLR